jgi:hypothetical protein
MLIRFVEKVFLINFLKNKKEVMNMNKEVFTAGSYGSDGCGCATHKETFSFGKIKEEAFNAGSCGGQGCLTHTNILIA